jgi:phospholipase A2
MSNNIPFYPLLRRDVDIVIAIDTSADIQTTPWFERTDGPNPTPIKLTYAGYAKQKGILGWPIGIGWPKDTSPLENVESLTTASSTNANDAAAKLASAKSSPPAIDPTVQKYGLGHCNIWIGTTAERTSSDETPKPKVLPVSVDDGWHLDSEDGIMVIYLPLLPNEKYEGVDPSTTEYLSTWNFQYTPEQIDSVVGLAGANFEVGEKRVKRAVRAMWLRKRQLRREREREGRILVKGKALVSGGLDSLRDFGRDLGVGGKDSVG